jgi:hypothetical protein
MHQPIALPSTPSRERIEQAEREMLALEGQGHGLALETWHEFADGLVARTILIPAGTDLVGAEHKAEHLNICHGDITVWTEHGMQRLTGYAVIPSLPGAKRIGRTHADTWWTTVHLNPGNERDVAKLEDALVACPESLQSRRLVAIENNAPEAIE